MSGSSVKVGPPPPTPFKKPEPPPPAPFKISSSTKLVDWKKWQISFRYYAHAINLEQESHDVQLSTFKSVVGPDALEIYNTFSILDITDVESVMRKFDEHFRPKVNMTLERYKLYKLNQKSGQKFDDYLMDVTNQVDKCEFKSMRDEIVLYKIVGGIENDEVRNALLADADLKLDKAVQLCRASSAMHFMSGKANARKGSPKKISALGKDLGVLFTEDAKKNQKAGSEAKMSKTSKVPPKTSVNKQDGVGSKESETEEQHKENVPQENKIDMAKKVEVAGPSKEEFLKHCVNLKPSGSKENHYKVETQEKDGSSDGGYSDWRGDDDYYDDDEYNDTSDGPDTSQEVGAKEHESNQKEEKNKVKKKKVNKKKLRRRTSASRGKPDVRLPCDMCNKTFRIEISLEKHRNKHFPPNPNGKTAVCFYCGKEYKKDFLRRHMTVRHFDILGLPGPQMFACDTCHFTTRFPENLQRHKFQHTGEKPLACELCGYKCIRPRLMKAHIAKVHTGERPFSCSVCNRGFLHSDALKRHMMTHEPPLERTKYLERIRSTCETCGKVFSSRSSLQTHSMRHTGEKPFVCHFCEFRTVTNAALNAHILSKHSSEKPFVCTVCGYSCKQKTVLKQHMLTHTAEKPHTCEVCGRKFAQISHVKRHMMTHTGEKPHVCEVCGHRWTTKENLKAHMRVHQKQSGDPTHYTPPRKRQKKVVTIIAAQSEESGHSEPAATDAIIQWSEQVTAINSMEYTPSLETPPPFHPTYPVHQGNPRPPDCRFYQQRQWQNQNQGYR